ncbi:MAG: hypothetical protein JWO92_2515 [Chitinophagaceae bacterium]|nr:hypothetical protein [Chitinophagaceae bacterium]
MTEASFQACRKIMQKANYLRGVITNHEGNVKKWTHIEGSHRDNLRQGQADGAKKMIEKAMQKLSEVRKKFADLKFPDSNIIEIVVRCKDCGRKIKEGIVCNCEED